MSSADSVEPVGDITLWVDTTLMSKDQGNRAAGPPVSAKLAGRGHSKSKTDSIGSLTDGEPVKAVVVAALGNQETLSSSLDAHERERLGMMNAEMEQCAVDNFWGLEANQKRQAEAQASMEREDLESHAVRAHIEKEEKFALWEYDDLRTRETRKAMREKLEDVARRGYLEVFYSAPSADVAINYRWPTRAALPRPPPPVLAAKHPLRFSREPNTPHGDSLAGTIFTGYRPRDIPLNNNSNQNENDTTGEAGQEREDSNDGASIVPAGSSQRSGEAATSAKRSDHSTKVVSSDGESGALPEEINRDIATPSFGRIHKSSGVSSTRSFHNFQGKKAYHVVPVGDSFLPPRHLADNEGNAMTTAHHHNNIGGDPTTFTTNTPGIPGTTAAGLAEAGAFDSRGARVCTADSTRWPAGSMPSNAVHLPPMQGAPCTSKTPGLQRHAPFPGATAATTSRTTTTTAVAAATTTTTEDEAGGTWRRGDAGETTQLGEGGSNQPSPSMLLKPGAPGQPLLASFQRKFLAYHERWSGEEEAEDEERAHRELRRAEELLLCRNSAPSDTGGRKTEADHRRRSVRSRASWASAPGSAIGTDEFRAMKGVARQSRRAGSRGGRPLRCGREDSMAVTELDPDREEYLLTEIFHHVDARGRGGIRLDEALFHITENAQVGIEGFERQVAARRMFESGIRCLE